MTPSHADIRDKNKGWELVEYIRELPLKRRDPIVQYFFYERFSVHGEPCGRATGVRIEGSSEIEFTVNGARN